MHCKNEYKYIYWIWDIKIICLTYTKLIPSDSNSTSNGSILNVVKVQESLIKYWKDFFSKEEEDRFLFLHFNQTKRLIKNKYSFNRYLFNLKKFWCYEEEIKEFLEFKKFINNKI